MSSPGTKQTSGLWAKQVLLLRDHPGAGTRSSLLGNVKDYGKAKIRSSLSEIFTSKGTIRQCKEKQIKWRILECEAGAGNESHPTGMQDLKESM